MTTNIYKFEQGRLLVHESRTMETGYIGSGVPVRIGQVRAIEEVLSVDTNYSQLGLLTPLNEVRISGNEIFVVMRRGDLGFASVSGFASGVAGGGGFAGVTGLSGMPARYLMSGITSGLGWLFEVVSGRGALSGYSEMSGKVTVTANVIGY